MRENIERSLSRRERQIMDILYMRGKATVSEVLEDLPDPPSYSAVRATLRLLEEKGYIRHQEEKLCYVYTPVLPRAKVRESALRRVVRTFFEGSVEQAVVALLKMSSGALTEAELDRLSKLIEQAKKEGR
jgi:BlaI family transcriptional regulator, penicillinase repressor